ncbi:MAG: hypothetical protein K2Q20_10165 [Phycisphaerales bacterium]|nr:hypothetical protein [Phycisphaerales bacterium]
MRERPTDDDALIRQLRAQRSLGVRSPDEKVVRRALERLPARAETPVAIVLWTRIGWLAAGLAAVVVVTVWLSASSPRATRSISAASVLSAAVGPLTTSMGQVGRGGRVPLDAVVPRAFGQGLSR